MALGILYVSRVARKALDESVGGERRKLGVTVVLAHEDYRQPPQARDIERLMKRAGLACAVAEKHDGDLSFAFLLGSKSRAQSKRNGSAHDSRGCNEASVPGDDVHRAAFTRAIAGGTTCNFSHEPFNIGALSDGVAVGAMATEDIIVGSK